MDTLAPVMTPGTGARLLRFVGDRLHFTIADGDRRAPAGGWRALLRTNLGRADFLRREILEAHTRGVPPAGASWRDIAMERTSAGWELTLPLAEVGFFKAKAYLVDARGWQHWPEGPDIGISVHPDRYRTGNVLYCAFPRMFGSSKSSRQTAGEESAPALRQLDERGYTVIPPSGKLRDVTRELPHIFQTLGCRILHLLPVSPTPTTYARLGPFGSPYAVLDLTGIDPALVVFDKRSTGVDQFRELTYRTHLLEGRVFLDIVINHTGWASLLQERHPEWFLRQQDGTFVSPGAWGTIWEDLVELKHQNVSLWDDLAETFLTWCRRGVDGFRCDAGYMVPVPAWQYIVARVQQEYPETIFFLEGLGGAWETTEALLTEGGMQWAYSELFQNYTGLQVAGYLDHSLKESQRVGLLVHYSETHDNPRLAARGRAWSLMRNRLCALASPSGGFGFTCGVEWLATEKIRVHGSAGMSWGSADNIVPELSRLNRLLAGHPCFFDGAGAKRLSAPDSAVYALLRISEEGKDTVLVLVNTELEEPGTARFAFDPVLSGIETWVDLLGQQAPKLNRHRDGTIELSLPPGGAFCLAPGATPAGLSGDAYRLARAQAAWGLQAISQVHPAEQIGDVDWGSLAEEVDRSPAAFLASVAHTAVNGLRDKRSAAKILFPRVIRWSLADVRRITLVPPGHFLLIEDSAPFRACLDSRNGTVRVNVESIGVRGEHGLARVAYFPPGREAGDATLWFESYTQTNAQAEALVRFLPAEPISAPTKPLSSDIVLLTNGRGGMARICVDLGRALSKYDCVLAANLHPSLPVDRHVFAKRIRVWVNADGFLSPLNFENLKSFEAGPPATWHFVANAGDGRTVEVDLSAQMPTGSNSVQFQFARPASTEASGKQLPAEADVRLTVRFDIEDRNFHDQTKRNGGAEHHFATHTSPISVEHSKGAGQESGCIGFQFLPAADRQLRVMTDTGCYHPQPEWSENLPHPVEQSRGQVESGDAYSPGWFEIPLSPGANAHLLLIADLPRSPGDVVQPPDDLESYRAGLTRGFSKVKSQVSLDIDPFAQRLLDSIKAFVVQRGNGKTIIAGYPWFLDWGRDTFICARGMITAGMHDTVKQLLLTFAEFEHEGTLPNTILGENASNRDTSDAPLWFALVAEELAALVPNLYATPIANSARTLRDVVLSIAKHYVAGTPNGIRMDPDSGLIWSPGHFTWMDTNHPAGTPREGYPVEIQALWIRLLLQMTAMHGGHEKQHWNDLAGRALGAVESLFWSEARGYYGDVLGARKDVPARGAVLDDCLRSNCLLLVSLGVTKGDRARRCVEAALRHLAIPGALRSLAPLPTSVPLAIYSADGILLNNPAEPYWGHYAGDEDTRRKPAYHNGTAWTWTFPAFCEALARAWECAPEAVATAKAYLGSMKDLLEHGCIGHFPEILDGDAPHSQRGCDAQAWAATEALRVWKFLIRAEEDQHARS